ncbi:MAG TPA: hypothetical protein DDY78_22170 [Planctomycetales bacterium]|jgi:hypothetical protein|nr:hypothetical protein [Planctomycetales bacterium]
MNQHDEYTAGRMSETLHLDGLEFALSRSRRRRTVGITVERDGDLRVTASEDAPLAQVESVARGKLFWVFAKLAEKALLFQPPPAKEYVSGKGFHYLGRSERRKLTLGKEEAFVKGRLERLSQETLLTKSGDYSSSTTAARTFRSLTFPVFSSEPVCPKPPGGFEVAFLLRQRRRDIRNDSGLQRRALPVPERLLGESVAVREAGGEHLGVGLQVGIVEGEDVEGVQRIGFRADQSARIEAENALAHLAPAGGR